MSAPGFWDDSEKAQALINRNNAAKETYDQFQAIAGETDELNLMWEMQQEEFDSDLQKELEERLVQLQEKISGFELSLLLDAPYDKNNAIVELHSRCWWNRITGLGINAFTNVYALVRAARIFS
ncbi:PCRF domain-containing protein [Enterococcus avium]